MAVQPRNARITVRGQRYRVMGRRPSSKFGYVFTVLQHVESGGVFIHLTRKGRPVPQNARLESVSVGTQSAH